MTQDILEKERDYHNKRFTEEVRIAQDKYYFAIGECETKFDSLVKEAAAGATCLEYGCATGEMSLELSGAALSVDGIDISDVAIAKALQDAAARDVKNVRFKVGDAHDTGYPDETFDLVFGSGIIHHLDTEKSLTEIRRVLKPGGQAVFKEPLGSNVVFNLYRRLTPSARTPDEHPLVDVDLAIMRKLYSAVDLDYFGLATLAAVPFKRMGRAGQVVRASAARLDKALFRTPLRSQAWYVLVRMTR